MQAKANKEQGMALVACLLVMVVLAMIGIGITTDSTVEIKIAANQKNKAVSFQNADSGTAAAPEIIEDNLDHPRSTNPYQFSNDGADPTITVHTDNLAPLDEDTTLDPGITITGIDNTGDINQPMDAVVRLNKVRRLAAGSAIQMAAGYEGAGKDAASGGVHIFFRCRSKSQGNNTISNTEIYYRHIPH